MASADIYLALITLGPVIIIYLLSVNGAMMFLSLCLGYVLYAFDSHNAMSVAQSLNVHHLSTHLKPSDILINLILLLGPAAITLVTQIHSMHGSKKLLNLLPAIFCGLFVALLIVPALPVSLAESIAKTAYWGKLVHYQAEIVGFGAAVAILFFFIGFKHSNAKKHAHKTSA